MKTNKLLRKIAPLLLTFNFSLLTFFCFSQGTAINTSGAAADNSAILDVSSNDKGVLIPRMSETERLGISSPARGLMVYQVGNDEGFWYYDGSAWLQFGDNLGNHTATDSLNMTNNKVVNLATCTQNLDAANKEYVDNAVAAGGGGSLTMLSSESLTTMNFGNAIRYCYNLNETVNGTTYIDWQLPNYYDMISVASSGGSYIPNNTSTNYFWLSNYDDTQRLEYYGSKFFAFRLSDGDLTNSTPSTLRNVRCVR